MSQRPYFGHNFWLCCGVRETTAASVTIDSPCAREFGFTGGVSDVPLKRKVKFISLGKLRRLERAHMAQPAKPNVVYHADWGSREEKRWCARAALGAEGRYTAFAPELVGNPGSLIGQLRNEAGETGAAFAGFDFPIGVPASYAERAGISSFRALPANLGSGEWKDFYSVCDKPEQISVHRPFYPNGEYKGRRKEDLFRGHGVSSVEPLLRRCERGGHGAEVGGAAVLEAARSSCPGAAGSHAG
jgi:hypothetical protein